MTFTDLRNQHAEAMQQKEAEIAVLHARLEALEQQQKSLIDPIGQRPAATLRRSEDGLVQLTLSPSIVKNLASNTAFFVKNLERPEPIDPRDIPIIDDMHQGHSFAIDFQPREVRSWAEQL